MPEISSSTIEQDIVKLEKELQEKKSLLEHREDQPISAEKMGDTSGSEKEVLKSIIGDKINQQIPVGQPQVTPKSLSNSDSSPSYLDPILKDQVDKLVKLVFDTNLEEGIKFVAKQNDPALIDAFHDLLADELYDALIERRKLEKIE